MTLILQINVGVCRAAQDLALATANVRMADVLIISEQYRDKDEGEGWYADADGRSAITVLGCLQVDAIEPRLQVISWIDLNGLSYLQLLLFPKRTVCGFRGISE